MYVVGPLTRWRSYRVARAVCRSGSTHERKLNLGCGQRSHKDWVNVDFRATAPGVIAWNLRRGLPFPDSIFGAVYHSHVLEHLSKHYAPQFMHECFRVMSPGGITRVVVPDLEQVTRCYLRVLDGALAGDSQSQRRHEWITLELLDQLVRNRTGGEMFDYWLQDPMPEQAFVIERCGSEVKNALIWFRDPANVASVKHGPTDDENPLRIGLFRLSGEVHQWMYDRYSLSRLIEAAGFIDVRVCHAKESSIPGFNDYLLDIEPDGAVRKPESLFMEGRKPP